MYLFAQTHMKIIMKATIDVYERSRMFEVDGSWLYLFLEGTLFWFDTTKFPIDFFVFSAAYFLR